MAAGRGTCAHLSGSALELLGLLLRLLSGLLCCAQLHLQRGLLRLHLALHLSLDLALHLNLLHLLTTRTISPKDSAHSKKKLDITRLHVIRQAVAV